MLRWVSFLVRIASLTTQFVTRPSCRKPKPSASRFQGDDSLTPTLYRKRLLLKVVLLLLQSTVRDGRQAAKRTYVTHHPTSQFVPLAQGATGAGCGNVHVGGVQTNGVVETEGHSRKPTAHLVCQIRHVRPYLCVVKFL